MKTPAIRTLELSIFTTSFLRWGGWLRAGLAKAKNELVADTTSCLPGAAAGRGGGGFRGRLGKGKNALVSDTNSFLPKGRVPWPFWLKVHAVPR